MTDDGERKADDGGREEKDGKGEGEKEAGDRLADDETDPFSKIETEVDDPFAELGEGVDGSGSDDAESIAPDSDGPDPNRGEPAAGDALFGATEESASTPVDMDTDGAEIRKGDDDPFAELGPATGDTEGELDEAFERMDVGGVADEDVWESIDEDATDEPFDPGAAEPSDAGSGETEHVVDKRTYCQQCPHFSAPPEVACTHEGTTIVEAVGFDEFRVRNCPMVSEDDPTFDADR